MSPFLQTSLLPRCRGILDATEQLGATVPKAVTAARKRAERINDRSGRLAPGPDALVIAVIAAEDRGDDPAGDPEVQRVVTASAVANEGVTRNLQSAAGEMLAGVLREHAAPLVAAWRTPFDAAARQLVDARATLGDTPLDDTETIIRQHDTAGTEAWSTAQAALQTLSTVLTAWCSLYEVTTGSAPDKRHRVLIIADPSFEQWREHRLDRRDGVGRWELVGIGVPLSLATIGEFQQRRQAIQHAAQQAAVVETRKETGRSSALALPQ